MAGLCITCGGKGYHWQVDGTLQRGDTCEDCHGTGQDKLAYDLLIWALKWLTILGGSALASYFIIYPLICAWLDNV